MLKADANPTGGQGGFDRILSRSGEMLSVVDQARRAACVDATVLLTGESGTGKELVAEAIHQNSPRRRGPFVAINMAAIPETLVESELFGHIEGAFTGAATRTGRFEAADGGTLFIDEIGDLRLGCQAKLLHVLENHYVTPVGSNLRRKVDVRIIAATHRNLERMIAERTFREDLYYRLNVVGIVLPPLRQRRDDILPLANHFLDEMCRTHGKPSMRLCPELEQFLVAYDWPGNVRQLRNCIESMVVLADGPALGLANLPALIRRRADRTEVRLELPRGLTLKHVERAVMLQTLESCEGNRTQAARSLGISVRTLQRRLKRWHTE